MTQKSTQQILLETLKEVKAGSKRLDLGICHHVRVVLRRLKTREGLATYNIALDSVLDLMDEKFEKWPKRWEGHWSSAYPVGGETEYNSERWAHTVWENPRRWELLNWLIETLEKENGNTPQ